MSRSSARISVLIVVTAALAAGCTPAAPAAPGSSSAPPSAPASVSAAASPSGTASAASGTPSVTPAGSAKPSAGTAQVDLHFTGSRQFDAVGTAGRCSLSSGTPPSFGFETTEADYPGLGQSFSLLQFAGNDLVDIKWVIDGNNSYGQAGPVYTGTNTITLSADHHSITLDAQLSGLAPQGQPVPGPEHVSGTISCP